MNSETHFARPHTRPNWHKALARAVRDPDELCDRLDLPEVVRAPARRLAASFGLVVPESYLARIRPGDPRDPLLRQVLPIDDEVSEAPGFSADPVGDGAAIRAPGLLQKYASRVLLITTGTCAIHCRYCFRRHFPYALAPRGLDAWEPALNAISLDPNLDEVILSGGDPLTLTDPWLGELARRLAMIPHLHRLRVHTRLPIVLPERVDEALCEWLAGTRLRPIVVVHANHPAELTRDCPPALVRLAERGILLLNQAVLLKGINDTADVQEALCRRLIDIGVLPYYLHQLDRVLGAAHFEVSEVTGRAILAELRRRLPGYAVPRYVREAPDAAYKVPID